MLAEARRRRIALFLASILIPAAVFITVGLFLYRQQRELLLQRLSAEQSQPVERLRDDRALIEARMRPTNLTFAFWASVLAFGLSVTLVCRYLVWQEFRRESSLAELRSRFVSDVSHELRTPLTTIQMFAETLTLGRVREPDRQRIYLETISIEAQRLGRLVDHVLAFTRADLQGLSLRLETVEIETIAARAVRAIEPAFSRDGFNVRLLNDAPGLDVRADPDALQQAILNLLTNAVKYSGPEREIEIRISRAGQRAAIAVSDLGIGIPPEFRPRVFERFFRVPMPDHQTQAGLGVGLTLVHSIVEAHRGRVEIGDNTPRGTVVTLLLPLQETV